MTMRRPITAPMALMVASLAGCTTVGSIPTARVGQATLSFANGLPAGTAQLYRDGVGLRLAVAASGLPAGAHGYHLHTVGSCEAPDFTSAGGHLNPAGHKHGSLSANGAHLGDLPNIQVGSAGTGASTEAVPGNSEAVLADIFDADGTAVVIHADPDDYRTDPAGNAGKRVACGVMKRVS